MWSLWQLLRWRQQARSILTRVKELGRELERGGPTLRERILQLRWRAKGGESLERLLPETYAVAVAASQRVLGKTHFEVQVMGGIALFHGHIAEMQTGEGKTLTAVLPATLRALPGLGCHVLTANEYLASRDAEEMGQVFRELGLSTGCILEEMEDSERGPEYAKDITYGTAAQFGFDFLRDRLKRGADPGGGVTVASERLGAAAGVVQRELYFALIDEADSILIDEGKTPLIIGLETKDRAEIESLYRWADQAARQLVAGSDYEIDTRKRLLDLTDVGCRKVVLISKPIVLDRIDTETIYEHVERALMARHLFERDRDYVVRKSEKENKDEIAIVDEGTGRVMEGRKWQDGLHQAIETKEGAPLSAQTGSAARITIQSFFRRYEHLAGMTGTGWAARHELKRVYRLPVVIIPTNRPCLRQGLPTRVFADLESKWVAVALSAQEMVAAGRSVLIGTPSVEASQGLSRILDRAGVVHRVLNAYRHAEEAEIVAQAGLAGRVTVSTNMAGRGTDILLEPAVRNAGGLHVIATEMHTSARIDRQLVGRAARQGDQGTFQFFLSLEDELLRALPEEKRRTIRAQTRPSPNGEVTAQWQKLFLKTQVAIERMHTRQRRQQLEHEKQRTVRYHKLRLDPFIELTD